MTAEYIAYCGDRKSGSSPQMSQTIQAAPDPTDPGEDDDEDD
ncbi:hypothetical protein [Microbacterium sp. NIBRBAC000506063]|nr:hypothetical protein [Microbacterium sp. NIBRBAC000506063]